MIYDELSWSDGKTVTRAKNAKSFECSSEHLETKNIFFYLTF